MYIKKVHIENFRNFKNINIPLNKYTTIIGENDIGKSNLFDALKLLLNNNSIQFYSKRLSLTDINKDAIDIFRKEMNKNIDKIESELYNNGNLSDIYNLIPKVIVKLSFTDAKGDYQRKLLSDWLNKNEGDESIEYEIEYKFRPKEDKDFLKAMCSILRIDSNANLPIEMYEYEIYSTNNNKPINFQKYMNFNISVINAERDNFSENNNKSSYRLISSLLEKNLNIEDKGKINKAYDNFFGDIKTLSSYKNVFKELEESKFKNLTEIINHMELRPNSPNMSSILSNVNIGYGDEYLFQKGLGKRNLILLILLFSNYYSSERKFNLICVEEPEAHLCSNNLNIILSYFEKNLSNENNFCQTIISTHNSKTINKLKFNNVVLLKENNAIDFNKEDELTKYLAKRPNFDILKILFSNKIILVEGATEEMLINTILELESDTINDIEVIAIGQKGYKKFLDIWKKINVNNNKKIGVVRDFDNQIKAKEEHDKYDNNKSIFVRTTKGYTLEDDLVNTGNNKEILEQLFKCEDPCKYMKENKTESMLELCERMLLPNEDNNKITISIPEHIKEIINGLQCM